VNYRRVRQHSRNYILKRKRGRALGIKKEVAGQQKSIEKPRKPANSPKTIPSSPEGDEKMNSQSQARGPRDRHW
jgi:hypothetical protein